MLVPTIKLGGNQTRSRAPDNRIKPPPFSFSHNDDNPNLDPWWMGNDRLVSDTGGARGSLKHLVNGGQEVVSLGLDIRGARVDNGDHGTAQAL